MDTGKKIAQYHASAIREDLAASRAACTESVLVHRALADLYWREIARIAGTPRPMTTA